MIMFGVHKESEARAEVTGMYFMPLDEENGLGKTKEELEAEGNLFVDEVLQPPGEQSGKRSVLYINPETLEQWYEYVDRPLTTEERLADAESKNGELTQAVAELSMALAAVMGA
ncbi:hypothetical protein ACTHPF_26890 [Paenibacillus sp. SAF-054]|uniref:hypothetical protein n=1 Tax=unclassified Paenibacillus TaxID=185978 RepID=UPI003F810420